MQTLGEQLSELGKSDCVSRNDLEGRPEHCCREIQLACPSSAKTAGVLRCVTGVTEECSAINMGRVDVCRFGS